MTDFNRSNSEKRRILHDIRRHEEEVIGSLCRLSSRPVSPKSEMEQERRIRREIANSNERRRMQSINAGFQSLRALLPHHEGEKLSKAAILQQTTQYIYQMEQEKTGLLTQNCQLKRLVNQQNQDSDGGSSSDSPLPKRKKSDAESPDELSQIEASLEKYKKELTELRTQLENERRIRMMLEDEKRSLEAQLYPERQGEGMVPHQVHLQYPDAKTQHERLHDRHERSTPSPLSTSSSLSPRDAPTSITATATIVGTVIQHDRVSSIPKDEVSIKEEVIEDECREEAVEEDEEEKAVEEISRKRSYGRSTFNNYAKTSSPVRCPTPEPHIPVPVLPREYQLPNHQVRKSLHTIVEAIRHLEGDVVFADEPASKRCEVEKERSPPLTLTATSEMSYHPAVTQTRPGVIVSAHS